MDARQLVKTLTVHQLNALKFALRSNITTDELFDACEEELTNHESLKAFQETKANYGNAFAALADEDDESVIDVFLWYHRATFTSHDSKGNPLPLATIADLEDDFDFVLECLSVGKLYRVQEGVIRRTGDTSNTDIVLVTKT